MCFNLMCTSLDTTYTDLKWSFFLDRLYDEINYDHVTLVVLSPFSDCKITVFCFLVEKIVYVKRDGKFSVRIKQSKKSKKVT